MNSASQWRLEFARQLAQQYAPNPKVAAVIVSGSTARGHADRYSDIEMGVFWNEAPTEDERRQAAEAVSADVHILYPFDSEWQMWEDALFMGRNAANDPKSGVLIELSHCLTEQIDTIMDKVLINHDPDPDKQNLVAGIVHSIPFSGNELVEGWKARAADYPRALAVAVVHRYAMIDHFWRWEMFISRGDNLMLHHRALSDMEQRVLYMLLALNRVYYFGFKWLPLILERLTIAPNKFKDRIGYVHDKDPGLGAWILSDLVEETYALIEQHLPEVEVNRYRSVFRWKRPEWEIAPGNLIEKGIVH